VATIGVIGLLAVDPRRRLWLDAGRATLLARAILVAPTVYGEVRGDGWQARGDRISSEHAGRA
jgi:hypothetical protein